MAAADSAPKLAADILERGGCEVHEDSVKYRENDAKWHPVLPFHGPQKCIECQCKVSSI